MIRYLFSFVTLALLTFSGQAIAGDMPPAPDAPPPTADEGVTNTVPDGSQNEVPADNDGAAGDSGASWQGGFGGSSNDQPADESEAASDEARPSGDDDFVLPAKNRLVYTNILAFRYNPLGLEERLWIGWQHRLTDRTDPLWNQANIAILFNPMVTPALARVGATLQVQPLSILRLRATYGYFAWFGNFQYMASFESPHEDHAPSTLDMRQEAGQNYATHGQQVELDALFQIKVKKFALRNDAQAFWNKQKLQGQDDVFYDIRIDAMVPNRGWALVNDTDLLFVTDFGLAAGVRGTLTKAFFPDRVYEQGDPLEDPNGAMYRVGPMLAYSFFDRPGSKFNKPTLVLIPQWNVLHRYRTGQDTHAAIPTLVLAFGFGGQLMSFGDD